MYSQIFIYNFQLIISIYFIEVLLNSFAFDEFYDFKDSIINSSNTSKCDFEC